jgi:hypothetical protein
MQYAKKLFYSDEEVGSMLYGKEKYFLKFGFSNKMICLAFLNRIEPFTDSFLQVNTNLDDPNRTLFSIENYWKSVINDHQCNSELTPEFFSFPEMFRNQ